MIICVDGTGSYSDSQYERDMANSFCKQICEQKGLGNSVYFEGPGGFGLSTRGKANKALEVILDTYQDPRTLRHNPLYLAGYSRGGACVLQIAKWLVDESPGIKIKGLILFDPVNRDLNLNVDGLGAPHNVKTVYAMFRDKSIEHVDYPGDPDRYARKWMGTCAWYPQYPTMTAIGLKDTIRGASHGAMGGCAWLEREADRFGEAFAADAMNKALKAEQLGFELRARTFPPIKLPFPAIKTIKLK